MSLKRKFVSSLSVAAVAAAFSVVSFGQETTTTPTAPTKIDRKGKRGGFEGRGFGKRHFGKRGGMHRGFGDLSLTDAQKSQIKAIREANKPDKALFTEFRTIREARRSGQELTADQKARVQAMRDQRRQKGEAVRSQILNVLTPEQRATLETRKTEMYQRRQERKQMRKDRKAGTPAAPKTI